MTRPNSHGRQRAVILPNPNGGAACGLDRQVHVQAWHPTVGWHGWIEPTNAQRTIRMRALRPAKLSEMNDDKKEQKA